MRLSIALVLFLMASICSVQGSGINRRKSCKDQNGRIGQCFSDKRGCHVIRGGDCSTGEKCCASPEKTKTRNGGFKARCTKKYGKCIRSFECKGKILMARKCLNGEICCAATNAVPRKAEGKPKGKRKHNNGSCHTKNKCANKGGTCKAVCDAEEAEYKKGCKPKGSCKCCVSGGGDGPCKRKKKCKNKGGHCVSGDAQWDCDGTLTSGCKGTLCQCCVPDNVQEGKVVKAAFRLTDKQYTDTLSDPNSPEYKALKEELVDTVTSALKKKLKRKFSNFDIEFFRNGSVIVDSKVTTTEKNQKKAEKIVSKALKKSGVQGLDATSVSVGVRLCVPGQDGRAVQQACAEMKEDNSNLDVICVQARDRYDCLQRVKNMEVDVVRGDASDVYLAKELFEDELSVVATTRVEDMKNEQYQYRAVAVVRRSTIQGLDDLEGSKSCHTGYGKTSGWHVPLSKLQQNGELDIECIDGASVVENDLSSVSSYFGSACIPGNWVPDNEANTRLKTDYSNLCDLCADTSKCDEDDLHAGYQGALKCLIDSEGDVAWTKLDVIDDFFTSRPSVDTADFGLLCDDGSIVDLDSADACHWAARPWPAWLTRANEEDKAAIVSVLADAMSASHDKSWAKAVLGVNEKSVIEGVNPPVSPFNYLNQAGYDTTISNQGCEADPVRLCVESDIAMQKCTELAHVLKSRRVQPPLTCVSPNADDDCVAAVGKGDADIVTLDGGDMFRGHREYATIPVISEVYGAYDASYFAVAVVRADSGITSLAQLKGKNSCHTGIGKTAGWKIPVVTLLEAGLLNKDECNFAGQIGGFFSESCAPGAKLPTYDPEGTNPESLCNLCVGTDGSNKCARDSSEAYYSYTGAFRCLVEGGGDVAFVKHTTVPSNTDGNSNTTWTKNLKSEDFRILCKNNVTKEVLDFESCNLARVPSHKVVTGPDSDDVRQEEIRILILRASETLPLGQDAYAMFGPYGSYNDIIFKSSATSLINLPEDEFNTLLESTFFKTLTDLECGD